jgi:tRNA threonylcarbamoyl adenosine modification protein YjeE
VNEGLRHRSDSASETDSIGRETARVLRPGDVVLLEGDLAAGKTTLVRGLVAELGGDPGEVSSPSFMLIQSYPCRESGIERVHHVDLYRIADQISDLRELGLEEFLSDSRAVIAVEWPKNTLANWIPTEARVWQIILTLGVEDDSREIEIIPPSGVSF